VNEIDALEREKQLDELCLHFLFFKFQEKIPDKCLAPFGTRKTCMDR